MAVVTIDHVCLRLGRAEILCDICLTCQPGEISGFVGRNGSGKSMLFKCVSGFIAPVSGTVDIDGVNYHAQRRFPPSMGFLIEAPAFLQELSGFQNLKNFACIQSKIDDEKIREVIRLVGLEPNDRKSARKYSLGMRQRLGIAQAIMEDPDILILDEPMNGLDNQGVEDMRKLFWDLKTQGKTILLSSHNREDIEVLCDHVHEMDAGKITRVR